MAGQGDTVYTAIVEVAPNIPGADKALNLFGASSEMGYNSGALE